MWMIMLRLSSAPISECYSLQMLILPTLVLTNKIETTAASAVISYFADFL
jgi:hypothetical protein